MIHSGMVDSDTNDIPTIDLLLKHGANVTNRLKDGSTILHVAASRGLIDLIKKCVKSGVDINAQDDEGKTPLINAIFNDKPEATCELILLGANVALKNEDGFYPIHFIADASIDFPCLSEILAKIKDIDATNEQSQTSLHLAAQKSTATFSQLLSKGASIKKKDQNGETALFYAAKNKRPNNVALCIENGIDVNVSNNSKTVPLIYAVKERDYPSVVLLLNAKADPNVQDDYEDPVLTNAAKNADYSIVVALLKAGARIDTSEFEEIQNSFYDTEKGDSIIALLKTPLQNLPPLPEIDLSSKDGFWWYAGTIPASQFKKGVCRMVSSEAESIDESEEMLRFSRYEIERYTKTNYLFEQNIQIFGDIVDIDETKYTVSRDSNQLYLYSENENDCKVFKYAGKTFPESWGNSTTDN
jgi:ankyrin repeat protein